ncbi:MAG: glutamate racemase [Coprobacillaceae bacterium]
MKRPIGLLDSGVGGLTVLHTVRSLLPEENIIYVGDKANCPYGDKSKEELFVLASRIVEYFITQNVKMIVHACNTTTASVLPDLQKKYPDQKFIGVIYSTVDAFIRRNKKSVLVIGTETTITSNTYQRYINECNESITVYALATPKLVPLVESGAYKEGIYDVLHSYLDDYRDVIDSIILGCTHYPILTNQIQQVLPNIDYISSSEAIGKEVKDYLIKNNLSNSNNIGKIKIYTTGDIEEFKYSSSGFFDYTGLEIEYLNLDSE